MTEDHRPLQAIIRVRYGPQPLEFDRLSARFPAVLSGLALAGEADLELQLACADHQELHSVIAELRQAGASHVQVEIVLRRLVPKPSDRPATDPTLTRSVAP